tara:strand:- start:1129 stop:1398 length:270 start_codon:yes stop_codon:yes gene_type:complete
MDDIAKDFMSIDELIVNSPPHYKQGDVECIEAIKSATGDGYQGYLQGNIMKYIWRYRAKGQRLNDLRKAEWYLKELIVNEYAEQAKQAE